MTDTLDTLKELFFRRREAEHTLHDPGMQRALADLREAAHETFAKSAPSNLDERENAYWMLRALDGIELALANRIAAHELQTEMNKKVEQLTSRAERRHAF